VGAVDLLALAEQLPKHDVSVVRVEQPWVLAGRRVAPAPKLLDQVFEHLVRGLRLRTPLIVGGRSAGARVALRTGAELGAAGCLALAFPLHPPGHPDKSRLGELLSTDVPAHVIQGERDPFGRPVEFPDGVDLTAIPGADHGFAVPRSGSITQVEALDRLVRAALNWLRRTIS
jgi:predicted alpha/beta-hydrolase family hydrolase